MKYKNLSKLAPFTGVLKFLAQISLILNLYVAFVWAFRGFTPLYFHTKLQVAAKIFITKNMWAQQT